MNRLSFRSPALLSALAAVSASLSYSPRASACSCPPEEGFSAVIPEDGAANVPTNVKILASTRIGRSTGFVLVDEQGNEIPLQSESVRGLAGFCANSGEYTPASELLPNHTYRLSTGAQSEDAGASGLPLSITFTTGEGPADAQSAAAPGVALVAFDAVNYANSCIGYGVQACLTTEVEQLLEVHLESAGNTTRYVGYARDVEHLEFGVTNAEVCVSVHVRDLAGNLSAPVTRCFDTASSPVLPPDDPASFGIYPDCDGEAVRALLNDASSKSGCSVVTNGGVGSPSAPGAWLAACAAAVAVARRKTIRGRRA